MQGTYRLTVECENMRAVLWHKSAGASLPERIQVWVGLTSTWCTQYGQFLSGDFWLPEFLCLKFKDLISEFSEILKMNMGVAVICHFEFLKIEWALELGAKSTWCNIFALPTPVWLYRNLRHSMKGAATSAMHEAFNFYMSCMETWCFVGQCILIAYWNNGQLLSLGTRPDNYGVQ